MSYCLYNDNKMYQIDIYTIWLATVTWQGYTLPDKGLVPDSREPIFRSPSESLRQ